MNYKEIVHNRFIKPLINKKTGNIGVELEFPMINLNKAPIETENALNLLSYFLDKGFKTEDTDTFGNPAFITNKYGDCISFDNSYNNIEFSMNYGNNLLEVKDRFYGYLEDAQTFLKRYNYTITGMGTNPYKKFITQSHVSYPVYNMVDEYLHKYSDEDTHCYPDFPAYLSSVQTHLDITTEDLPKTATLFAKIDFLRGLLFSNSPDFEFGKTICFRDYLWHNSAFGICKTNTGAVDEEYNSLEDIAESFYCRHLFNNLVNEEYRCFYPIPISKYFNDNEADDINQFLSFRHIETTYRGTLEIRSDCAQPLCDAFVPPAFNLGIAHNIDNAIARTEKLLEGKKLSNSYLRNCVSNGIDLKEFTKDQLTEYAVDMVKIAEKGLYSRGIGEECLIKNLHQRAKTLRCPAIYTLENVTNIDKIIDEYSKF